MDIESAFHIEAYKLKCKCLEYDKLKVEAEKKRLEDTIKEIMKLSSEYNYWDATLRSASDVIYKIKELCEDS